MWQIIHAFAGKDEHAESDACFVVIMSHGTSVNGKDYLSSCDDLMIDTDDILAEFNNANSPVLQGKPKVFLFQSCRGDEPDAGVPVARRVQRSASTSTLETDTGGSSAERRTLPTWTDMLIVHSTVPGSYLAP
jgi:caspase-like apoptosis-related cysteine protease